MEGGLVKEYRHTGVARSYNAIITLLLRLGAPLRRMALLTVVGRVTGEPRTTPIAVNPVEDGWVLTAPYGVVDWVKNLRAAGEATITTRGRRVPVTATEMPPQEAAPQLRGLMADAPPPLRRMLGPYFDTPVEASIAAWEVEAVRHPMFRLRAVGPD